MVIVAERAKSSSSHFRNRVWLRLDLLLQDEDFDWILQQVRQPEYPTFVRLKEENASQIHVVQMKKAPGVEPVGYVVLTPHDGVLRLVTAYKHHYWGEDGKTSTQRKVEYARALERVKEWLR